MEIENQPVKFDNDQEENNKGYSEYLIRSINEKKFQKRLLNHYMPNNPN